MQQNSKKGRASYHVRWLQAPQRRPGPRFRCPRLTAQEYLQRLAYRLRYRLVYIEPAGERLYRAEVVYVKPKGDGQSLFPTEREAVLL